MFLNELKLELDPFIPFTKLYTSHSQTLVGHVWPSPYVSFELKKQFIKLDDGDELLVEYTDRRSDITISLYHGLAGDAHSDYMRRTAIICNGLGWNVVMVNHRGIKNAQARQTYHSGRGTDACAVIRWCKKQFPGSLQVAAGFSMSGSILLNLLTNKSGYEVPDYAVVVHAPLDLGKSSFSLTRGLSKVYDIRFYLLLSQIIKERDKKFNTKTKLPIIGRTMDIDELYSAKTNGFKNAKDYYDSCSTISNLNNISTKTFVLTSHDDPFIDVQDYLSASWSKNTNLVLQKYGGHMGYYSKYKNPNYGRRWLDHYLSQVFAQIIKS